MVPIKSRTHPLQGFSLLELLMVIVLIAFVLLLATGGYSAVVQSTALSTGAQMIEDTFSEARQAAMTQNTTVEIRIYSLAPQAGSPPVYDALQLHWLKPDGTTPPVGNLVTLPAAVVIDATAAHSSIIAANSQVATPDATDKCLNNQTRVFHFLPDGTTDLDPTVKWFLTLRPASQSDPAHFPSNWAAVQVDPTTGHGQIYRP